jgi:hypothetical protein
LIPVTDSTQLHRALTGDERVEAVKHILDIIKAHNIARTNPVNDARERLATYSDSTISLIIKESRSPNHRIELVIIAIVESDEHTVREVMHLHPYCAKETAPKPHKQGDLISIIRGLHRLDRYKTTSHLDTLTGSELDIAAAFINVTSAVYRYFENSPLEVKTPVNPAMGSIHISSPVVQQFIADHHHRTTDLFGLFKEGLYSDARSALSGFPSLRWYKEQKPESLTGETIDKAISYLRITAALNAHTEYEHLTRSGADWNYQGMYLHNQAFENLVEQHYDNTDTIIEYIKDRGSADPETLRHYLANNTALKGGVL